MKDKEISLDEFLLEDDKENLEPERLKIENIEHLENLSNHYGNLTILDAMAAGTNGLASLLFISKALTQDLSLIEHIPIYLFALLSIGYIGLSANYHKLQQDTNEEIDKIKFKSK